MGLLETPAAALAWIGRQGTRAVALSVFAGLALPWLPAPAKPAFTPSLFVLLCLAFLRAHVRSARPCPAPRPGSRGAGLDDERDAAGGRPRPHRTGAGCGHARPVRRLDVAG